jgi:hypothetical protein
MLAAVLITIMIAVQIVTGVVPVPAYRPLSAEWIFFSVEAGLLSLEGFQ